MPPTDVGGMHQTTIAFGSLHEVLHELLHGRLYELLYKSLPRITTGIETPNDPERVQGISAPLFGRSCEAFSSYELYMLVGNLHKSRLVLDIW